jgi:hypothetical protein
MRLRSAKDLTGYTIGAIDTDIGSSVCDFYFDDQRWTIRYIVVARERPLADDKEAESVATFQQG